MTQSELKELKAIGAELGAAKAEVVRLREALHAIDRRNDSMARFDSEINAIVRAALSRQAEPTDTFTAVDMATAAAQGFRDGQAAVEQAVAQDERDAFYAGLYKKSAPMWHRLHELAVSKGYDHVQFAIECAPVYRCDCMGARKVAIDMAGNTIPCECVAADNETEPAPAQGETEPVYQFQWREIGEGDWMACSNSWFRFCEASPELDTRVVEVDRPAQTEQQPVEIGQVTVRFDGKYKSFDFDEYSAAYSLPEGTHYLYAAPIAQTAPQGKFRMGDLVKKSTGSEWVGHVCGWYSTNQTPEGYAVESAAHKGSVQIYPAKALEAVE